MQSTAARVAVGIVLIAIVVVGFIALSGDDSEDSTATTATTATIETTDTTGAGGADDKPSKDKDKGGSKPDADVPVIEIKGGAPVGGIAELEFDAGDEIRFEVESDTAAEVHVHGYDIAQEVEAGGSTEFAFPADIEGIFEVELEETATHIAEITVNP